MLLFIDNYDSFTYNIVQYLGQLGQEVVVYRNDEISCDEIACLKPQYLVIGPGPCTPFEAGISMQTVKRFAGQIPIFGVCLGHQTIGAVFGGKIVGAKRLMHGKISPVFHNNTGVFTGLPNPVQCVRYHSLSVERETLPETLTITAWTEDGEIMGLRHQTLPIESVQFHPEALLTECGTQMFEHFLQEFSDFQAT